MSMTTNRNIRRNIDTTAGAATTLEQQFRFSPRPSPTLQGIDHHHHWTGPLQNFFRFRTNPVRHDDDDDDASCSNDTIDDIDQAINRPDSDFIHQRTIHPFIRDDNEEDDEEEEHDEILQTPDHTMFYYDNLPRYLNPV